LLFFANIFPIGSFSDCFIHFWAFSFKCNSFASNRSLKDTFLYTSKKTFVFIPTCYINLFLTFIAKMCKRKIDTIKTQICRKIYVVKTFLRMIEKHIDITSPGVRTFSQSSSYFKGTLTRNR
jgi:hypothetical protein